MIIMTGPTTPRRIPAFSPINKKVSNIIHRTHLKPDRMACIWREQIPNYHATLPSTSKHTTHLTPNVKQQVSDWHSHREHTAEINLQPREDSIISYVRKKHISRETWPMFGRTETKRCDIPIKIDWPTSRQNGPSKLSIHKNIDFKILRRDIAYCSVR